MEHGAAEINVEALRSFVPKLSPLTVTDVRPVLALLNPLNETTGVSKENRAVLVPAVAPTVSWWLTMSAPIGRAHV